MAAEAEDMRRRARLLIIVTIPIAFWPVWGGPAAAAQSRPFRTSDELFETGSQKLLAGDAAGAVLDLREALARRPEHVPTVLRLAEASAAAGDRAEALRLLANLLTQRPEAMDVRIALARERLRAGQFDAAVETLRARHDELTAEGMLLLAEVYAAAGRGDAQAETLAEAVRRFRESEAAWTARIECALRADQCGRALRLVREAEQALGPRPVLHLLAALCYFELGQYLGRTEVREVKGARAGQFREGWMLVEARDEPDHYLCCPAESALYRLRQALDNGCDQPRAHILHAKIWRELGRPALGLAILQAREAALLEPGSAVLDEALETLAGLALESDRIDEYLRYVRLMADRRPDQADEILLATYLKVAERYNQGGDAGLCAAFLRRAMTLRPDDLELKLRCADAEWDAQRHEEARRLYRMVLEAEPTHPQRVRMLERVAGPP